MRMKEQLVTETAKIEWKELERFYAQGKVLHVSDESDLVAIAAAFAEDDTHAVKEMQAQVAPFILVQSVTGRLN